MAWGSDCPIHALGECFAGCLLKGRRLHQAYSHVWTILQSGLEEANSWTDYTWGLGVGTAARLQGAVRMVYHAAQQRLRWLNRIPWLCARIGEPGVAERCLAQWASAPAASHHRVSVRFVAPGGPLRDHVIAVQPDGTNVSPELAVARDWLRNCSLDDSVGERPHAQSKWTHDSARHSGWVWMASTIRLPDSLHMVRSVLPDLPASGLTLEGMWSGYSCILHSDVRKADACRPRRMKVKKLQDWVYHMAWIQEAEQDPLGAGGVAGGPGGGGDDPGPGGGGGLPPGDGGHGFAPPDSDSSRASHGDDDSGADDGGGGGGGAGLPSRRGPKPKPAPRAPATMDEQLMRQWCASALQTYAFVSFPVVGDCTGEVTFKVFQILSKTEKVVRCETFDDDARGLYTISLQPFELFGWKGDTALGDLDHLDVFALEDPLSVDVLQVAAGGSGDVPA